jgi:hypothetical protein
MMEVYGGFGFKLTIFTGIALRQQPLRSVKLGIRVVAWEL